MPGPQLTAAVEACRTVRARLPHVPIVWGGYFPTQHADTVLGSSIVDFVVRSQGEQALLALIEALAEVGIRNLELGMPIDSIGLSWRGGPTAASSTTRPDR